MSDDGGKRPLQRAGERSDPRLEIVDSLESIAPDHWNRLGGGDPFVSHEFLSALHETGCASAATGWTPHFLIARRGAQLAGAVPLYLKTHSYGEYVFDWAWADAYHRHGIAYYPKLVATVPFTPVTGPRLLADGDELRGRLLKAVLDEARALKVSSLHCLFAPQREIAQMLEHGMMERTTVQFHWHNRGYRSFDEFASDFSHDKRKKLRQERRKVADAGVRFRWLEGDDIRERDWAFFHRCYRQTYRDHHSTPYLSLEFFLRIGRSLPRHTVLILAERDGVPVASSLHIRSDSRLCGRYWGTIEFHPGLHFETCYYQGIEYCIARGIAAFEGGSRGEHKLARGLMPVETRSAHWLAHPAFARAVGEFLRNESSGMESYVGELNERGPFRRADGEPSGAAIPVVRPGPAP